MILICWPILAVHHSQNYLGLFCLTLSLCRWYKRPKKCCKQEKLFMGNMSHSYCLKFTNMSQICHTVMQLFMFWKSPLKSELCWNPFQRRKDERISWKSITVQDPSWQKQSRWKCIFGNTCYYLSIPDHNAKS